MKKTTAEQARDALKELADEAQANGNSDEWVEARTSVISAALELGIAQAVEPVDCQFQSADGRWHSFLNDQHKDNTIAAGTWPIRNLYAAPQEPAAPGSASC